ncbi:glycerol-3-phosphate 1-O-acyltransferase PlsY [Allocoprobacillus halotolerans]|uniref:Glycerol-3-phosphate acyltransferase n=1 Tax=Allocoprobacillus halotolerans TaxID=2944914 RepID=A0ABY5I1E6_9FIRM|nr:glycerol-3-phosphate 1-O-acyltransferase PlsY [Allocoprobacillus halotolerans]UTY38770.1 glycerol-3-phosphate 1-O-acyltransferase PlsY [Allocoprobacillus halotolerans]
MDILVYLLLIIMGYLYGSIPFALVIGKLFYHTDVRNSGSGNLGGTNAGRVLGKKAGLSVIILDTSKCCISIFIAGLVANACNLNHNIVYLCALACVIGHCYPIFAGFRGGKAVSVALGYALMTNIYAFLIALVIFLITLKLSKYVSLASILASISIVVISPFLGYSTVGIITNICIVALLVYKHLSNIQRIKDGTENKITWM